MPARSTSYKLQATSLTGKKVTVMGLGLHGGGVGTVRWLAQQDAIITVTDKKTQGELSESLAALSDIPNITYILGEHRDEDVISADLVIRNPSVPRTSPYLATARSARVPIEMDSSLFFAYSPSADIIGITGSKGKTTTANAMYTILHDALPSTVGVGMDGVSPLAMLDAVKKDSPVVFELSSWRLEALEEKHISPKTSVVTSIYRDHLNTYDSFEEYIETKKVVIKYQEPSDTAILNADDEHLRTWRNNVHANLFWYSLLPFSESSMQGIFIEGENISVRTQGEVTTLFSADTLPLQHPHERRNLLPAILIAFLRGISTENIRTSIMKIQPLAHRMELVRELKGVTYINDSASTMPDATIAALQAMKKKNIILILGGNDKKLEFTELAQEATRHNVRAILYLPGDATKKMKHEIDSVRLDFITLEVKDLPHALMRAQQIAHKGDTVLFSPGATSFGQFLHEFDRGDKFKSAVNALT